MLSSTLFVDIEAGDIAVADLPVAQRPPPALGRLSRRGMHSRWGQPRTAADRLL